MNRIHTLSIAATKKIDRPLDSFDKSAYQDVDEALEALISPQPEDATFCTLMSQMPFEIRCMIEAILNDAKDFKPLVFRKGKNQRKETDNEFLWRLVGQTPHGIDLEEAFVQYFREI